MNKEQPKPFNFLYPVTDTKISPAKLLTNLDVSGTVETGRLSENLGISILHIAHTAPGERMGSDIKTFLRHANPSLYKEICEAALNHATEKYGLKRHQLLSI